MKEVSIEKENFKTNILNGIVLKIKITNEEDCLLTYFKIVLGHFT